MATLYLTEQGSSLKKTYKRLLVEKDGEKLLEVPEFKVDRVLVFGNVQITTQAMAFLLDNGIETSLLSTYGKFRGRLAPVESKNVLLRVAQYERYLDEEFKLEFSKTIIKGKIVNAKRLIQRYSRNHPEVDFSTALRDLDKLITGLKRKAKVSTVMGVEGRATAIYFETYGQMFPGELGFKSRTRRPATDPVNSLLSFGYVLITNEIFSVLSALGFDPYIGYLHGINYGRPSLALDLAEEFRHPIVDMLTLDLINRRILTDKDFESIPPKGVFLRDDSKKKFFKQYEYKILHYFKHPGTGAKVSFRDLFKNQAHKLQKTIMDKAPYEPFLVK